MKLIKDVIGTFVSLFKGLKVTLINWSWLRPSVTELYPEEKPKLPERFRGMPTLPRDPKTGLSRCIACGSCARVCPEHIITVEADKSEPKSKKPSEFTIDISRCMFCGLCMEVCPVKCLKPADHLELTCRTREEMIYDLERLMEMGGEFPPESEKETPSPQPSPASGEGEAAAKTESGGSVAAGADGGTEQPAPSPQPSPARGEGEAAAPAAEGGESSTPAKGEGE